MIDTFIKKKEYTHEVNKEIQVCLRMEQLKQMTSRQGQSLTKKIDARKEVKEEA